jgi:transcriptional regulator of acetoin/glycerol metabolism
VRRLPPQVQLLVDKLVEDVLVVAARDAARRKRRRRSRHVPPPGHAPPAPPPATVVTLPIRERDLVARNTEAALHACAGNRTQAAVLLGVSRVTVYMRVNRAARPSRKT